MDTVSKAERSRIMAAVRSKNTRSTERRLRAILIRSKVRGWRYQVKELPGKPDFVFPRKKIVVFVDGCFWHGCSLCYRRPASSQDYWDAKVAGNIARDRRTRACLRRLGWSVLRIWEHEISQSLGRCMKRINSVRATVAARQPGNRWR